LKTRKDGKLEDGCVLCNVGKVEDVEHFAFECEELGCELLGRPCRIVAQGNGRVI